jgi:hypothetical protein
MIEIMNFLKKIQQIDTLFVIYPKGDYAEKENLLRIFNRHWNQTIIRDTVFGEFEGDIFDMNAKTTFNDSALNSLFKKSTPLLFNRDHHQIRIIAN